MINTATQQVRQALGGDHFPRLESPSLRLEKFVRLGHANKGIEVAAVIDCHQRTRRRCPNRAYAGAMPGAGAFAAKLGARLIVNQAGGILENAGICLHRHFGFPMLPGSAVKGIAAHAAWLEWRQALMDGDASRAETLALHIAVTFGFPCGDAMPRKAADRSRAEAEYLDNYVADRFPALFGETAPFRNLAGAVAFLPAVPVDPGSVEIAADIVNCHHPKYYAGQRQRATDDEDPIPNVFPVVEQGAEFLFTLRPVSRPLPERLAAMLDSGFAPVDAAKAWLIRAVVSAGAGAKTAAGYGWFEFDAEVDAQRRVEAEKAAREAEEKRRAEAEKAAQLAAMSPEERQALDYWEKLPASDRLGQFKGRLATIGTAGEDERRILLVLCRTRGRDAWLADRREYEQVKDNPKKRDKNKAFARVGKVLDAAKTMGMQLP